MSGISENIRSLSDFKQNTSLFLHQLKETTQPILLTVNGHPELVIQDASAYRDLLSSAERQATIDGIRRGLSEMRSDKGKPFEQAVEEIKARYQG